MAENSLAGIEAREAENQPDDGLQDARKPVRTGLQVKTDVRSGISETNGHTFP